MEPRYTTPTFRDFWNLENKYRIWLAVEYAAYQTMVRNEVVSGKDLDYIEDNIHGWSENIDIPKILEIESRTRHDVVAFLEWLENISNGKTRFFHYGMTSSDLVDTAFSIQLIRAMSKIDILVENLSKNLLSAAEKNSDVLFMGRTHGMNAQPTTLSNFFLSHYNELHRSHVEINKSIESIRYGKLSGPVGSYINISPKIEAETLEMLGLYPEPAATQVIPRDRYLNVIYAIMKCSIAIERLATNIRHLHRTEVSEIKEGFKTGQTGSSSMPYKENPVICENLCGLSRYIRGLISSVSENCVLWNERDISHSSVERIVFPEATTYISYMIESMDSIVTNLVIDYQKIGDRILERNIFNFGETLMLILIDKGMQRSVAHSMVRDIVNSLNEEKDIPMILKKKFSVKLSKKETERLFSIYDRVVDNSKVILKRAPK